MKKLIQKALEASGHELVSIEHHHKLLAREEELGLCRARVREYDFLLSFDPVMAGQLMSWRPHSCGQLQQDLFVLATTEFRRRGYFVEFGAANGKHLSNTHLLEKHFDWTGILAEPAPRWHVELAQHRTCRIDHRCVWRESGQLLAFDEVEQAELSTLAAYASGDGHAVERRNCRRIEVQTVSLLDLLSEHGAPRDIDYLSVDTEGSELEILTAFDFSAYRFGVITVEHNRTKARDKIKSLLEQHGYRRRMETVSEFDDWYVLAPGA